jgi:maltose-binding protein MalE
LLTVLLTACSPSLPTRKSAIALQGTLLIWHPYQGDNAKVITDALNGFQQLNPQVQIISESIPPNELSERFIKEGNYGFGPDIMIDGNRLIPELVKAGRIQPIPEKAIDLSSYFPKTWTNVRYQGKIYGWPLAYRLRVLCYNQAKIEQTVTDKTLNQPPSGLDGLIKRSQKGYSVGMVSSFEDTFWGMGIFGAKFFDAQGFVKPELEGWGKWLEWLKQAGNEPNFILIRNRDILHNAFAEGQLTYYVCDSREIADLKKALKDNLRVATLPAEPNRLATPILYPVVITFNRNSSPNQTNLALKLTEFLTNPEQQLKAVVQSQTFIPSNQKIKINEQFLPIEAVLQKQSQTAVAIPLDRLEQVLGVAEQGEFLYQKAIAGDITPNQAAQKLTEVVKQQMNQNPTE